MIDEILEDYSCDVCKSPYVQIVDILSIRPDCGCNRTRITCERCSTSLQSVIKSNNFFCKDHGKAKVELNVMGIGGNRCLGL